MRILSQLMLALALSLGASIPAASGATVTPQANTLHKVRGFLPDLSFTLLGAGGKTVTQDTFKGKTVLMFFGYTNCPDVCPTTMAQLSQVMLKLGDDAKDVRILFVSVDPHRDTPDKLQAYVNVFDKNAIGLTGSERQIADLARRYRVAYQIEKPTTQNTENYEVSHSRGVYIFDRNGRAQLLAADTESVANLTAGVKTLLARTK